MPRLLLALLCVASLGGWTGCANERVYRCSENNFRLSGRCGDPAEGCSICGRPAGCCLGHPLHAMKEALHCQGCGECYWDEWYSDPPAECDPCDDCGNHIGERCCPPKRLRGAYAYLAGGRHADVADVVPASSDSHCADGSCTSDIHDESH